MKRSYQEWQMITRNLPPVSLLLDLEHFEENLLALKIKAQSEGKKIRLATKSIRVLDLIIKARDLLGESFGGCMCFSVQEMNFLHQHGLDNLLLAYPTVEKTDLEIIHKLLEKKANVYVMADHPEHFERLHTLWKEIDSDMALPLCLDIDASLRLFGGLLHLGVRRSSIVDLKTFEKRLLQLESFPQLKLKALMAYEAQIAGLGDQSPFAPLLNGIKKLIKKISKEDIASKRAAIMEVVKQKSLDLDFFNGGGTGSIDSTCKESAIDEVAIGSGLFHPHLFDYYQNKITKAALFFTLPITRRPAIDIITCQSGGFIASGEIGPDKAPQVFCPKGLKSFGSEGFGEVQTPFKIKKSMMVKLGDRLILRSAKAGEVTERFNSIYLIKGQEVIAKAKTYRGEGEVFY